MAHHHGLSGCVGAQSTYEKLHVLHEQYASRGLSILGFPCNQFGGQESVPVLCVTECVPPSTDRVTHLLCAWGCTHSAGLPLAYTIRIFNAGAGLSQRDLPFFQLQEGAV